MKRFKFIKTKLSGEVDDVVPTLEKLKDKATWLDGNLYQNNMLIYVEDKKAVYKIKVEE